MPTMLGRHARRGRLLRQLRTAEAKGNPSASAARSLCHAAANTWVRDAVAWGGYGGNSMAARWWHSGAAPAPPGRRTSWGWLRAGCWHPRRWTVEVACLGRTHPRQGSGSGQGEPRRPSNFGGRVVVGSCSTNRCAALAECQFAGVASWLDTRERPATNNSESCLKSRLTSRFELCLRRRSEGPWGTARMSPGRCQAAAKQSPSIP